MPHDPHLIHELKRLVTSAAPGLLELVGVGWRSLDSCLPAPGTTGPLRSEAAFAPCAAYPRHHRLNRGGPGANNALYTVVLSQLRCDPRTTQRILRHSSITVTTGTYREAIESVQRDAVSKMDTFFLDEAQE